MTLSVIEGQSDDTITGLLSQGGSRSGIQSSGNQRNCSALGHALIKKLRGSLLLFRRWLGLCRGLRQLMEGAVVLVIQLCPVGFVQKLCQSLQAKVLHSCSAGFLQE